jgi:hypothetical protein
MASQGIYTFGNDVVYDQLIALLNSIEVNVGQHLPVCVIPYDDKIEKILPEIRSRDNVTLYDNWESIQRWEDFVNEVWAAHPRASDSKLSRPSWYKGHTHRKLVGFDGPFDKFVFYDTDSLAMKPLDNLFEKLDTYDFVFDDWEHIKPIPVAALNIPVIEKTGLYQEAEIRPKLHCSSFFGGRRGVFDETELSKLRHLLIEEREVEWINGKAWWDEASLFTYMTLRSDRPLFNFTLSPEGKDRTGNCADADPFVTIDNVLYNQDGLKPIHRIHYMSYPCSDFTRLSQGEDVDICYRDIFLYYRFMKQPEQRPKELKPASLVVKTNRMVQKTVKKIKRTIS